MRNAMTVVFKAIMVMAVVTGFVFAGSAYSERVISVTKHGLTGSKNVDGSSVLAKGNSGKRIPLKGL